jgi:hypothetical protein
MSGRDGQPRSGYPNGDSHPAPADLAAVQADDLLLDMLGRTGETPSGTGDELTQVLAAWRREVLAEPVKQLVDTDTAVAVIRAARRPARRWYHSALRPLAAAAAVLVIGFSGVGLAAKSAQPGDRLWGVTQVLYSDYARSVETAAAVRTELNEARAALQQGKPEQAKAKLERVQQQLPAISEDQGRTALTARHRELEQILNSAPDATTPKPSWVPMFPPPRGDTSARPQPPASTQAGGSGQAGESATPSPSPSSAPGPTSDSETTPATTPTPPVSPSDYPHPQGYPGAPPGNGPGGAGPGGGDYPPGGVPASGPPSGGPSGEVGPRGGASYGSPYGTHMYGCGYPGPQPPYCPPRPGPR